MSEYVVSQSSQIFNTQMRRNPEFFRIKYVIWSWKTLQKELESLGILCSKNRLLMRSLPK